MSKKSQITFRKKHMIAALVKGARISAEEAEEVIKTVFAVIKKEIIKKNRVRIDGFGRFTRFKNHQTVPWDRSKKVKKYTVVFRACYVFKRDYLNESWKKRDPEGYKKAYKNYWRQYMQRKRAERIAKGIGTPQELARDKRRFKLMEKRFAQEAKQKQDHATKVSKAGNQETPGKQNKSERDKNS